MGVSMCCSDARDDLTLAKRKEKEKEADAELLSFKKQQSIEYYPSEEAEVFYEDFRYNDKSQGNVGNVEVKQSSDTKKQKSLTDVSYPEPLVKKESERSGKTIKVHKVEQNGDKQSLGSQGSLKTSLRSDSNNNPSVQPLEPKASSFKNKQIEENILEERQSNGSNKDQGMISDSIVEQQVPLSEESEYTKNDFYLKINLDFLEVVYKLCDDFGAVFKPYISITAPGNEPVKFPIYNMDEEKLDISGIGDNNTSLNMSSIGGATTVNATQPSFIQNDKRYMYKTSKTFLIKKEDYYSTVLFQVKNEQSSSNTTKRNQIIIGEAKVQINILSLMLKEENSSSFDGYLRILLRNSLTIGKLKLSMSLSLFSEYEKSSSKISYDKILDTKALEDPDSTTILSDKKEWNRVNISCQDLSQYIVDSFISGLSEEEVEDCIGFTSDFIDKSLVNDDGTLIYQYYFEIHQKRVAFTVYEFYIKMIDLINKKLYEPIFNFYNQLDNDQKKDFLSIPSLYEFNPYITKYFLFFIYQMIKYLKSSSVPTQSEIHGKGVQNKAKSSNIFIEDITIINQIFHCLKNVHEYHKNETESTNINQEDQYFYQDIVSYSLNILLEMISTSQDMNSFSPEEQKIEYTKTYENSVQIISSRIHLLRLVEKYLSNSQIISGIMKVLRKVIQILTNYHNKLIITEKLVTDPKLFSKEFKKILISHAEGIFFITFYMVLSKYYHYPEVHMNCLIIICQVTSFLDCSHLKKAATSLNLQNFMDVFDMYRGRLRAFPKLLNNLHLSILANFSEMGKLSNLISPDDPNLILIAKNLCAFYKFNSQNLKYKNRYDDFKTKKRLEIEIHESITRIGLNLTQYPKITKMLLESTYFFDDILDYILLIAFAEQNFSVEKDFINYCAGVKKKDKESVKKITTSIVENSLKILINGMTENEGCVNLFVDKLQDFDIGEISELFDQIEECRKVLLKNGCNLKKIDQSFLEFKDMFEKE